MSTYSKRIKIHPSVLLEYTFDDTNYKSEDYQILNNLKDKTKSYLSESTINNKSNSLFQVDAILSKYSTVDTTNFNFLKIQDYFTSPILNDRMTLYFPQNFDFVTSGYYGFYVNVYTFGYDDNSKYSLSNFFYSVANINTITLFDYPTPFYYDEKMWVKSIELQFPSVYQVSNNRIISGNINVPKPDTINENLTYGEGLTTNMPIFIDFSFISSSQMVMNIPYYYMADTYSVSLPQTPEFTELGVSVLESTQGDYFEIFGTYLGSNENMDEFAYKQEVSGLQIQLQYIISLYEENILTSTQTYQVVENFTQKILYRPIIQFSNTTAAIDVELRIVNVVDGSYISKFGSLGITNSLNKYGLKLTRLNVNSGVVNAEIFNMKVKNTVAGGTIESFVDVMKVPYPVMIDRYRILTKSNNTSPGTNDYVPNGLLEILITSFDNVIQFNIAQDINSKGEPVPYDLSTLSVNSNLKLVFKSDSEKLERDPFFEADNNYEIGNISFKLQEKDYKVLRRIYDKGYDNFYLVVSAANINTQLYSGKFLFYEDVTFINTSTVASSGTTNISSSDTIVVNTTNTDSVDTKVDKAVVQNNPFVTDNMPIYVEDPNVDKNYTNLIIYVRYQINIDKMDAYLKLIGISPEIKYGNVYFLKRVYNTTVVDIKSQNFIEKVFEIPLTTGMSSKTAKNTNDTNSNLRIFR